MNEELRNIIGKAAYEVLELELPDIHPLWWDELSPEKQEINKKAAESAVSAYLQYIRSERGEYFDGNGDMIVPDYAE